MSRITLAVALFIAAAAGSAAPAAASDEAPACMLPQRLLLAEGGLAVSGGDGCPAVPVAFDTPALLALPAIARATGVEPSDLMRNEECGAGPMEFARFETLVVMVQDGRFAGWTLDGPGSFDARTESGIGIGSTRAEVEAALGAVEIQDSTLTEGDDAEFWREPYGGFLTDATARGEVQMLYSGITCFFR